MDPTKVHLVLGAITAPLAGEDLARHCCSRTPQLRMQQAIARSSRSASSHCSKKAGGWPSHVMRTVVLTWTRCPSALAATTSSHEGWSAATLRRHPFATLDLW